MNNIVALLIITSTVLTMLALWLWIKTYRFIKSIKETQKQPRYVIAILTPSLVIHVTNILRPFIAYIKKYASFEFETIECIHHLDREQGQEWANFIVENNIDLILTVGRFSTDIMYHTMKTRQHKIPIISSGAPLGHSEPSLDTMQSQIPLTAITTQLNWATKIIALKKIIPHIKNVLIIFRSMDEISRNNLQEKNTITTTLRKLHIGWKMHHVAHIEKTTELNAELLKDIDLIIISRSSEVLRYVDRIAHEARQFNIPIVTPDITNQNIFIGIAECPERAIGIQSAQYAIEILEDGINPSQLPIKEICEKKLIVIYPHNSSPMLAATAIGNLLAQSNQINLTLKPDASK